MTAKETNELPLVAVVSPPVAAFHTLSPEQCAAQLGLADVQRGLSDVQAATLLERVGLNELKTDDGPRWWRILLGQLLNALTVILVLAMIMSFVTNVPYGMSPIT
jgi:magnesium-transporting ATPase (P-type)